MKENLEMHILNIQSRNIKEYTGQNILIKINFMITFASQVGQTLKSKIDGKYEMWMCNGSLLIECLDS